MHLPKWSAEPFVHVSFPAFRGVPNPSVLACAALAIGRVIVVDKNDCCYEEPTTKQEANSVSTSEKKHHMLQLSSRKSYGRLNSLALHTDLTLLTT